MAPETGSETTIDIVQLARFDLEKSVSLVSLDLRTMLTAKVLVFASVLGVSLQVARRGGVKNCQKQFDFESRGDLNLGFIVKECDHSELILAKSTIHSAIWLTHQLNRLNYTGQLKLGISAFTACQERGYLDAVFKIYQHSNDRLYLGIITDQQLPSKVDKLGKVLDLEYKTTARYWNVLVKVSVKLLSVLEWKENITVVAPSKEVLDEFYRCSRRESMCVKKGIIFE